ncbi:MAG TPA: cysteine synthase family protein [Pseudonocardiaceae bacterium]|nr:cysteine synthase family protein [Pseudonocardiaceae bacterium]
MTTTVLDLIGWTPVVELKNLALPYGARMVAKWERTNPGGSIKDRPALRIIDEAERRGLLRPGGTIIESSSGNFGISVAMIAAARGYRSIILVDPKTTEANLAVLRAFGAEVIVVDEPDDSGSYHKTRIKKANDLAAMIAGAFRPDQCFNLLNSRAHYESTAVELLKQVGPELAALVATVSTGGQLGGLSQRLLEENQSIRVIGADAVGSGIFAGQPMSYRTPGVGLSWTPSNIDLSFVHQAVQVPDELAFQGCRLLARREGLLTGASSGLAFAAAVKIAAEMCPSEAVAMVLSDGGDRYLSNVYSDDWLGNHDMNPHIEYDDFVRRCVELPWLRDLKPHGTPLDELYEQLSVPTSTAYLSEIALGSIE